MGKSFTIHDLPVEERPRERLVKFGEQALSVQELLQVILGRGIAGESVVVTALKLAEIENITPKKDFIESKEDQGYLDTAKKLRTLWAFRLMF